MKKNQFEKNIVVWLLLIVLLILSSCRQDARSVKLIQEPTDELIIYVPPNFRMHLPLAIRIFEREFPHVLLEVRTFVEDYPPWTTDPTGWAERFTLNVAGMEDFNQALRSGLITHRGPDVVIWYDIEPAWIGLNVEHLPYSLLTFPDLYKTAAWTNLFLDLEPLFLADPDFNREDYVEGVFDG
jgi:hypothetical protein